VLLQETLAYLAPRPGGTYCDATLGYAGHAAAILDASAPDGQLVGLDRDPDALAAAREALAPYGDRTRLVHTPFSRVREALAGAGAPLLDGCVVDLGVSSPQLDRAERGFSFKRSGPLDMRMDPTTGESAADYLRRADEEEIEAVLRDFGEERHARRIARAIVEARAVEPLDTTGALAALVARTIGRYERKDPATRTFQALRIRVNRELEELDRFLDEIPHCLKPGGRLVVIAFHSIEDRIVKRRLRALAGKDAGAAQPPLLKILTKHVVVAGDEERARNPRARSAHLRAAERLPS
jgi:16S rRNA (cytosine1402-N4)-methyltransferase